MEPATRERRATAPPRPSDDGQHAWTRLEDQLRWYDSRSVAAQQAYKRVKVIQITLTAAIPLAVAVHAPPMAAAVLGAVLVVLEGLQQLNQWQTNWVLYRSTAEALKHEQHLYLAEAGPYAGKNAHRVLAERIEGLVSQEHAKWAEGRHQNVDGQEAAPPRS